MKNKTILLLATVLFITSVGASDYIIQDSSSNPLFVVNQTGEKQIQNGNLYLNGNSILDNQGALTLGGGAVEIPGGNLELDENLTLDSSKSVKFGESQNWSLDFRANNERLVLSDQEGNDRIRFDQAEGGQGVIFPLNEGNIQLSGGPGAVFLTQSGFDFRGNTFTLGRSGGDGQGAIRIGSNVPLRTAGGGSNQISIEDATNGNQNIIAFKEGGNVSIPNGNLNVNGNSITNIGQATLGWQNLTSYPSGCPSGEAVRVIGDSLTCVSISGETSDLYVNESGDTMTGNLDLGGNNITSVDTLKFQSGMNINGSINMSGDLDLNNQDIDDVKSIDGGGDAIQFDDSINLQGSSSLEGPNEIRTGGQNIQIRDTSNGLDIARFREGGNVVVPNGELEVSGSSNIVSKMSSTGAREGFAVEDTSGSTVGWFVSDGNQNDVLFENKKGGSFAIGIAGTGSREFVMSNGGPTTFNTGGSEALRLTSNQNVRLQNGNLELQGNKIVDTTASNTVYVGDGSDDNVVLDAPGTVDVISGNLDMNQNRITNVPAPQSGGDAVNKSYVDTNDAVATQTLSEVLSQGNTSGSYSINLNGNSLYTGGSQIEVKNSGGNDVVRWKDGGNVEIPNGDLDMSDNNLQNLNNVRSGGGADIESKGSKTEWEFGTGSNNWTALYLHDNQNVEIPGGNLNMKGNSIQNVGSLTLGWQNLTSYPAGCASDEAVQVVGDSLGCTSLNPGGTVETGGGSKGQIAYFTDSENISGGSNFHWNNSETRLGLGTTDPSVMLDVTGQVSIGNTLSMNGNDISNPGLVDGVNIESPGNGISISGNQYVISSGAIDSNELATGAVTNTELDNTDTFSFSRFEDSDDTSYFVDPAASGTSASFNGDVQVQGNLDVWGSIRNTDVTNLNVNGSILPPSGFSGQFNIGNSTRKWKNADFSGNIVVGGNVDTVDLDNPGNAITLSGNQYMISSGAIGSNEIGTNAITSSGGELDSSVAGNELSYNSGALDVDEGSGSGLDADLLDGVQLSNMNWSDVAMAQGDIAVSDLGAADANLDMNENQIQNVDGIQDNTGTDTIRFDGSGNVVIPGGTLDLGSNEITSVSNPTDPQDAATKDYVDTEVSTAQSDATQNLSEVLTEGNSAGSNNINMNNNAITSIDWASSDDGSGSGLDADLLDGMEANEFENETHASEHAGNFLSASSDTLNVQASSMSWGDLGISRSDVDISDINPSDADLNMSGNSIREIGGLYDSSGTQCGSDEFLNGLGNCVPDSDSSTTAEKDLTTSNGLTGGENNVLVGTDSDVDISLASSSAGAGIGYSAGVLSISSGNAITVNTDSIAVDATALAGNQLTSSGGDLNVNEGSGSGLNADQLDGMEANEFENESHASEHDGSGISVSGEALNVNTGNGLTISSDNLGISAGGVDTNELATGAVGNVEIQNSAINGTQIQQLSASSGEILQWDGSKWVPATDDTGANSDELVAIDGSASAGYIGNTSGKGVLRTASPITYTDNGGSIQLGIGTGSTLTTSGGSLVVAGNSIDDGQIVDNGLDASSLATGSVGTDEISDNSVSNTDLANSQITVSAGDNISVSGSPVSLGGTVTVNHADTSSQADVDNSNGNVVQDILLDANGHLQTVRTANLDGRYYTESESDSNFVDASGDTMSGYLNLSSNSLTEVSSIEVSDSQNEGTQWELTEDSGTGDLQIRDGIGSSSGLTIKENQNVDIPNGNLNVPNSITSYFDSDACPAGEVIEDISNDGTFVCNDIVGEQSELYVNESGDTMEGNLDFAGYNISNVGTINASTIQRNGNSLDSLFVDEAGDSMSGNLNMQGHHVDNLNFLELNSVGDIRVDGTDAIRLDSNQTVKVPNGLLQSGQTSNSENLPLRVQSGGSTSGIRFNSNGNTGDITWNSGYWNIEDGPVRVGSGNLKLYGTDLGFYAGGTKRISIEHQEGSNRISVVDNDQGSGDIAQFKEGGNVAIPNGNLSVNGQLTVGSTECSTGQYIDGDGTCTSVTGSTSGEYVDESGDTMTGDLDMNYNAIGNVSRLNVSTSTDQIAEFTDTGVTLSQPLSVESSGPLSVANGIDMTGSSSNTIDSYSTMYLQTSSGSPSDIVLDPTGEVGIDSNASIVGDLDMQNGAVTNVNWSSSDNPNTDATTKCSGNNVFLDGSGTCRDITNDYGNVVHGDLIQADTIDNSEIQNSNSFTFGGITSNGNIDMSNNKLTNVGDGMTVGNNGILNSDTYAKLETGGGGSSKWAIYDAANTQPIAEFNEGREVDIWNLDMNSNQIANVQNPDNAQDAATKDYVDSQADSVNGSATQTLSEVLSEGNDATSTPILNIGSNNIDIDGSGAGNIDLNSQEIQNGNIVHSSNFVAGSYSTGSSSVDGGDVWVENDVEVQGDIVGAGGDVAEKINNESKLEPGTVVTISGNMSVDRTEEKHDTEVAGVVSTDPAMVMAKERDGVPIAMTGTAEVKVTMENGEITPGDMLTTSSTPGKAMKCEEMDSCQGSIIGKALESAKKSQKIKMLISMS